MRLLRRGEPASTLDLLVAGLGNPGGEHAQDRHNVGWMVVDELGRRHSGSFKSKFKGRLAETRIGDGRVALLKPETYMNESGQSISAAARFFKAEPERVLVVHDDVDLPIGRFQARLGGGLAGHNGLRSISKALGSPEFLRLRVGAGRPASGRRLRPLAVPPRGRRRGDRRTGGRRGGVASRRRARRDATALQLTHSRREGVTHPYLPPA
jgi:peptidyl-tRNA hydrolase, PTH1 family